MTEQENATPASGVPITLEEILEIKHPDAALWSPNSQWLAWRWDDGGLVQLWAAHVASGELIQVSEGDDSVGVFAWSADSRLAYIHNGDVWLARPGADRYRLTNGGGSDAVPSWSPSGDRLAFTRSGALWLYSFQPGSLSVIEVPGKVIPGRGTSAGIRWSPDGSQLAVGILDGDQRDVVVVTVDGEIVWRTDTHDNECAFAWVDDDRLHYTAMQQDNLARVHRLVDLQSGAERELVREESDRGLKAELPPRVRPGGGGIVYVLTPGNWPHFFYLDLASGELRQITDGECDDTGHADDFFTFSPDGSRLVYASNRDTELNQRRLWVVEIDSGVSTLLTPGPGTDTCADWSPDGTSIAYVHCSPFESADIWTIKPDGTGARQISHSMPAELTRERLVVPEHVTFPSRDGLAVHGDLLLPHGFDPNRRYPAVIWVHGGMARQMRHGWHPMRSYAVFYAFHQYLLHRGFVVLSVDYRGSIGYGRAYEQGTYLNLLQGDLDDVVAGASYLSSLGYVDPESIAVYGLSYGGYLTLGALTKHPDVFALGINLAGIWDWEQYEEARTLASPGARFHGMSRLGGPKTEKNADAWFQASPRNFVESLKRPLLNLMGTADANVDYAQLDSIIRDCVEHRKDFAVAYYPGESHMFTWRKTWLDAFPRIERAFDRYLKTPPAERPPAMM